jgi:hypothetical protein
MHQVYIKSKDKVYLLHTEPIRKHLITIPEEISIKNAVLNSESWEEIIQIKLQITEGYF